MPRYKRVLLKLSGEALAGDKGFGLDSGAVVRILEEIKKVCTAGVELAIVVGGGNMLRGRNVEEEGPDRVRMDYMGMLGTVMNALSLQDALEGLLKIPTRVQTAIPMSPIAEPYNRERALHHLEQGCVVIFGAGTGHPFFSTDTAAALRAAEIGADCLVKGTNVDGIYDADPRTHGDAKFLPHLTPSEALERGIEVMDAAAFSLCHQNHIPILVLNIQAPGRLGEVLLGDGGLATVVE